MKLFLSILFSVLVCYSYSQTDSLHVQKIAKTKPIVRKNTLAQLKRDSTKKNTLAPTQPVSKNDAITFVKRDTADSLHKDSSVLTVIKKDSISLTNDSNTYILLTQYPILSNSKPELMITAFKQVYSKDILFYALLLVVIFFGIIKFIFPRYVKNIFGIIFQTQFRQIQTKEQLSQDNVASMLLNIMFIITTSFFIALALTNTGLIQYNFWKLVLGSVILLTGMYLFKLLFTNFLGWIFNKSAAAKSYTFLVFIVNKIIGVLLVPVIFLIAFSEQNFAHRIIVITLFIIGVLLLIRLFLTFRNTSNLLKINVFHFFIYFCCVEILPLLLIFKFLNNNINGGFQL